MVSGIAGNCFCTVVRGFGCIAGFGIEQFVTWGLYQEGSVAFRLIMARYKIKKISPRGNQRGNHKRSNLESRNTSRRHFFLCLDILEQRQLQGVLR